MEVVEVFESLLLELGFIVANWEKEVYVSVLLGFFSAGGIPQKLEQQVRHSRAIFPLKN